jgi:hypothetical protein
MNDKDFFDFAHGQYQADFDLSTALYPRAGIILTAQVVLGGAILSLGRHDLFRRLFERVDVFLYYVFAGVAVVFLILAVSKLIQTLFPREYPP